MCTLVAIHQPGAQTPLLVAANRDEMYGRASLPPEWPPRIEGSPAYVAGTDVSAAGKGAGGTWLGATPGGLFVGLTNQKNYGVRDSSKASRGEVVRDALRTGNIDDALAFVRGLDARRYNGFNLLLGDAASLHAAHARPDAAAVEVLRLPPGVHVLGNDRIGSPDFPKAARIESDVRRVISGKRQAGLPLLDEALPSVLASHAQPSLESIPEPPDDSPFDRPLIQQLQATCIHTPAYGTVSSTLIAIDARGLLHYAYADGAPCTHPFAPIFEREDRAHAPT